uniref:Glycosyltransferase 2-like domain-containing protein n=1 Tax=viral metagenome TaxID=1070528 RepID=A0A6C0KX00_9ZZZZ
MYYLSLLGIFKNEADGMKEWLDHYLWQGIEHFYIINNCSNDNYIEILKPYIDSNIVTLYERPEKQVQVKHYNEIFELIKNDTEWLIIADFDEYWYAYPEKNIPTVLKQYENKVSAIFTNWQFFGSNAFIQEPDGGIRENFIMKWHYNNHIKGIVCTMYTTHINIHYHNTHTLPQITLNHSLYLNHYGIRSLERFNKVKISRGSACPYNGLSIEEADKHYHGNYFKDHDKNEVLDTRLRDLVRNASATNNTTTI